MKADVDVAKDVGADAKVGEENAKADEENEKADEEEINKEDDGRAIASENKKEEGNQDTKKRASRGATYMPKVVRKKINGDTQEFL